MHSARITEVMVVTRRRCLCFAKAIVGFIKHKLHIMKLIDLKTLAAEKSISVFTLRKYAKTGMPHYRVGRKILVNSDAFDNWFDLRFGVQTDSNPGNLDQLVSDTLAKLNIDTS